MLTAAVARVPMPVPPYRLSGVVYGTLLNHRSAFAALRDAADKPPYKAPPRAPVLYIKPRNTLAAHGDAIQVPADSLELEVGGCLGLVIGRTACRVPADRALEVVSGYVIMNDVSVPHETFYRPSIRFKARDGFCPIGPRVTPRSEIPTPDALEIRIFVEEKLEQSASTAQLIRPVANLLADVSEFMTLSPGDVLGVGVAWPVPRARAGQTVAVEIEGLGRLGNRLVGGPL